MTGKELGKIIKDQGIYNQAGLARALSLNKSYFCELLKSDRNVGAKILNPLRELGIKC